MSINLKQCDSACTFCVKKYIDKHRLKKGDNFKINCEGIPLDYLPSGVLYDLDIGIDEKTARALMNPVDWAAHFLDWHCIDPDGAVWKRKNDEGTLGSLPEYDPIRAKTGKSIFHRPYQKEMLCCSSKRKIFRLGRQLGKTESLCISILYNLYTNERFAIEVIAPYQSQIDLIFTRILELINTNAILKNSVLRNVKAPQYQLKLKNDSYVIGFTAGSRSGGGAGASRGQHANMLVFDESDYLNPEDIDAALAVIINYPNATVWMSSTPTGRREKFYESCHNPLYREFHYPSTVNPNWSKDLENLYRSELTANGYTHEIDAEFGEQQEGVYSQKHIETAQMDFNYGDFQPDKGWIYTIGVDWNDQVIGTTIAVIGLNLSENLMYLVDKEIVNKAEWTQLSACNKIAELNRKWQPDFIYVDQGYGSTQLEVLRDYGFRSIATQGANSPDARLRNIVKAFDFGSNIEIRDLFTKLPIKKPAKPFLVENSVRRFEGQVFKYPKADVSFTQQLQGYIIDKVSQSGRPIYAAQNEKVGDHFLDAVNLALVAFTLEKSEFAAPKFNSNIGITSPDLNQAISNNKLQTKSLNKISIPPSRTQTFKNENKILKSLNGNLPAANTGIQSNKPWSIPGWSSDTIKPEAQIRQINIFKPVKGNKPIRKKF